MVTKMYVIVIKLKNIKTALKQLNKTGFSNVEAADVKAYQYMCADQYHAKHTIYMDFLRQKAKKRTG